MEVRRSARVASEFLVAIQGLEKTAVLRRGNISTTGVYFTIEGGIGPEGTMARLALSSADRARTIMVMAYVVRSIPFTNVDGRELIGVAFEFFPEDEAATVAIQELVRYVLSLRRDSGGEAQVAARLDASASVRPDAGPSSAPASAKIRELTVRSMVLDADWGVAPGERVLVDIFAPGMVNRIRVEGCAVRVLEKPTADGHLRYEIELGIDQQSERPLRSMAPPPPLLTNVGSTPPPTTNASFFTTDLKKKASDPSGPRPTGDSGTKAPSETMMKASDERVDTTTTSASRPPTGSGAQLLRESTAPQALAGMDDAEVSQTIDDLLSALVFPPVAPPTARAARRTHLSGSLAQIPVTTLMSLFEMEQLTGKLLVRTIGGLATLIFVRKGQIVDVECPTRGPASPRDLLASVLQLPEGSFEFIVQPVERADRVQSRTTALLLDLTRQLDEEARDVADD